MIAPFQDKKFDQYLGGKPSPQSPPSLHIDEDWEIWGCSPGAWAVVPRSDRWFELHRWEPGKPWFSPEYTQFLREYRGIVYTGGVIPEIQNHRVYPIERVEAEFSAYFLHSSLSLMLAEAILTIEDFRTANPTEPDDHTIGMWGVDMAAHEEYGDQRDGCVFFILEALRRGIQVYVPPESCLLRPKPIYGLCEWDHSYIKMTARSRELNQRREHARGMGAEAARQEAFLGGALDNLDYNVKTWTNPYGLPAGVYTKIKPGTGLGGGITLQRPPSALDGFIPITGSTSIELAAPAPEPDQAVAATPAQRKPARTRVKPSKKKAIRKR